MNTKLYTMVAQRTSLVGFGALYKVQEFIGHALVTTKALNPGS